MKHHEEDTTTQEAPARTEEQAAAAAVRLAHSFVCDAAVQCNMAGLTRPAVTDALREASQGLMAALAAIEGTC